MRTDMIHDKITSFFNLSTEASKSCIRSFLRSGNRFDAATFHFRLSFSLLDAVLKSITSSEAKFA